MGTRKPLTAFRHFRRQTPRPRTPLARATCTHEIDTTQPIEKVVAEVVAIGAAPEGS